MAIRHMATDGKGRALFGIVELCFLNYKFIFIANSILSIVLTYLSIKREETKTASYIALGFGILSASLVFIPFWKLMI